MKVSIDVAVPAVASDSRSTDAGDGTEFAALLAGFAAMPAVAPTVPSMPGETTGQLGAAGPGAGTAFPAAIAAAFAQSNAAAMSALAEGALAAAPPSATFATAISVPATSVPATSVPATSDAGAATPAEVAPTDGGAITLIDLTVTVGEDPAPTVQQAPALPDGECPPTAVDVDGTDLAHTGPDAPVVDPDAPASAPATKPNPPQAPLAAAASAASAAPTELEASAAAKPAHVDLAAPVADPELAKDGAPISTAAAAGAAAATASTAGAAVSDGAPKLVIPPNRVDTVAVAAARASAESTRPIRLSVRLDPPNLGEVRVELTARGNQVTMRLEPTAEIAGPALQQQRAAVAEALERTGFQLTGFDVANPEQQKQGFVPKQNGRHDVGPENEEPTEPIAASDGLRI